VDGRSRQGFGTRIADGPRHAPLRVPTDPRRRSVEPEAAVDEGDAGVRCRREGGVRRGGPDPRRARDEQGGAEHDDAGDGRELAEAQADEPETSEGGRECTAAGVDGNFVGGIAASSYQPTLHAPMIRLEVGE
jgi:hypothetical protein